MKRLIKDKVYQNKLFRLPEDILDNIFAYHDPYKKKFKKVIFDLKLFNWWYKFVLSRRSSTPEFHTFMFSLIKGVKSPLLKKILKN
jgi:hypothetical protein